jgi:hypothetical protein
MPKAYSGDLRVRVIEMVRAGASRREAAEVFSLSGGDPAGGAGPEGRAGGASLGRYRCCSKSLAIFWMADIREDKLYGLPHMLGLVPLPQKKSLVEARK